MKDRKDIDIKYTWDLEKIYSSISDFNKDYELVKSKIKELFQYEKKMTDNSNNFYNTIKLSFEIERLIDKLSVYTSLSFDLDTSNNEMQELSERVSNLRSEYSKNSYFIVPSILKLDRETIDKYMEEVSELKEYEVSINEIYRYKDHTLSDEEER